MPGGLCNNERVLLPTMLSRCVVDLPVELYLSSQVTHQKYNPLRNFNLILNQN